MLTVPLNKEGLLSSLYNQQYNTTHDIQRCTLVLDSKDIQGEEFTFWHLLFQQVVAFFFYTYIQRSEAWKI